MTTFLVLNYVSASNPISHSLRVSSCLKPKGKAVPARDTVIDFGKHKGKMLGTLPSNYLKWVSKNLRAREFEHWAKLADQVLEDPVYKDRIEWEFAENVLHGNNSTIVTTANDESGAVSTLLEISERFGWDNDDKAGWSKVKFELLGTSSGGRIPRVAAGAGPGGINKGTKEKNVNNGREGKKQVKKVEGRREVRRERVRLKGDLEINNNKDKEKKMLGSFRHDDEVDKDQTVEIYNPFPGRQSLLNKVLNNRTRF